MRLRLAKITLAGVAVMALAVSSGASDAAGQGTGPFIVASKVVSDTKATPVSYVGDIGSSVIEGGCAGGDCGSVVGGGCESGSCGGGCESGGCESGSCGGGCESGSCGGCGDGGCEGDSCGGCGGKMRLGGLISRVKGGCGNVGDIDVGCQGRKYDRPDLFYNFFSKGNCNQANAQMYISPLPVPHFVGHTFNTYQPFYPHEFMYWHKNRYNNTYDNGRGLNRTRALYYAPPVKTALSNLYWNKIRLPR